ncbi:septum formation initiator family protein [Cohnella suwonensis]|uniref:Septum formation initiator family protein n=1 Tax=Cohnella suwonensis TaxID=696072 RepID=A0ABW0LRQ6_9BACL
MTSRTMTATPAMTGARRRMKLFLFVMVLFMSWAAYVLIIQQGQIGARSSQLDEVDRKLTDVQAKNEGLKQQINRLNDDEYMEQIAKKEHGLGLPGERIIQTE